MEDKRRNINQEPSENYPEPDIPVDMAWAKVKIALVSSPKLRIWSKHRFRFWQIISLSAVTFGVYFTWLNSHSNSTIAKKITDKSITIEDKKIILKQDLISDFIQNKADTQAKVFDQIVPIVKDIQDKEKLFKKDSVANRSYFRADNHALLSTTQSTPNIKKDLLVKNVDSSSKISNLVNSKKLSLSVKNIRRIPHKSNFEGQLQEKKQLSPNENEKLMNNVNHDKFNSLNSKNLMENEGSGNFAQNKTTRVNPKSQVRINDSTLSNNFMINNTKENRFITKNRHTRSDHKGYLNIHKKDESSNRDLSGFLGKEEVTFIPVENMEAEVNPINNIKSPSFSQAELVVIKPESIVEAYQKTRKHSSSPSNKLSDDKKSDPKGSNKKGWSTHHFSNKKGGIGKNLDYSLGLQWNIDIPYDLTKEGTSIYLLSKSGNSSPNNLVNSGIPSFWISKNLGKNSPHSLVLTINPYMTSLTGSKVIATDTLTIKSIQTTTHEVLRFDSVMKRTDTIKFNSYDTMTTFRKKTTSLVKTFGYGFDIKYNLALNAKWNAAIGLGFYHISNAFINQRTNSGVGNSLDSGFSINSSSQEWKYLNQNIFSGQLELSYRLGRIWLGSNIIIPFTNFSKDPNFKIMPFSGKVFLRWRIF